jgi:putative membrane protein insertion efficiency factor
MDRQGLQRLTVLVLQGLIRVYQLLLSPLLPPSCRYLPSCSDYAVEAIGRHGAVVGVGLAARRLARCHPWGRSGYDPVPEPRGSDRCGRAPVVET